MARRLRKMHTNLANADIASGRVRVFGSIFLSSAVFPSKHPRQVPVDVIALS